MEKVDKNEILVVVVLKQAYAAEAEEQKCQGANGDSD